MATAVMSDAALLAFLGAHPDLRARIASIAGAIENSAGDLKEADRAIAFGPFLVPEGSWLAER